ncbi:uncharacterized protein LY89DRAFT_41745 [Mollisia scopiformis]|uniref:2EXR domain-containing protein n=1 Tax=Mollisia scopiformis TaxID=149040 RepID=A0A194XDI0_MOLSC|nr:uncharacterized protein LY89DRAFT_41745 [Mollisia scopiformis]KUJ18206.1 hypothetical protein LY89DRAFT_41745 [Mollisia scopiformis]
MGHSRSLPKSSNSGNKIRSSGKTTPMEKSSVGSSDYEPLQTFELFPDLAPEIRCLIWKLAANHPRLISFSEVKKNKAGHNEVGGKKVLGITLQRSDCPQPAILQVCRESHNECLSLFGLVGGTYLNIYRPLDTQQSLAAVRTILHEPKIYFNNAVDTLFLYRCMIPTDREFFTQESPTTLFGTSPKSIAVPMDLFGNSFNPDLRKFLDLQFLELMLRTPRNMEEIVLLYVKDPNSAVSKSGVRLDLVELDDTMGPLNTIALYCKITISFLSKMCQLLKHYSVFTVHGKDFGESSMLAGPQVWLGNRMLSDGKGDEFDPVVEALVDADAEKVFKCPRIKIMGMNKYGPANDVQA